MITQPASPFQIQLAGDGTSSSVDIDTSLFPNALGVSKVVSLSQVLLSVQPADSSVSIVSSSLKHGVVTVNFSGPLEAIHQNQDNPYAVTLYVLLGLS